MQLRHVASTDNGRARDHNEDTFAIEARPRNADAGALFVLCDGMGGFAAGEIASDLAARTVMSRYYAAGPDPATALHAAFLAANEQVWQRGRGRMGTTGIAAVFLNHVVLLANVGDSRGYFLRGGAIRQLTRDHSFVADQVSADVITAEQARESSYRNIITRALGIHPEVDIDLFREELQPGDRVLLCSDGLSGQMESDEISAIAGAGSLQVAVDRLIALANERGGPDNITVILVEVVTVDTSREDAPLPEAHAPRATTRKGQTERLPPSSGGTRRLAVGAPSMAPSPATPSSPPLRAAETVPFVRRARVVGQIFLVLIALALLGGMFWFVVNGIIGEGPIPPTPIVPTLTPPGAVATPVPTLVPTGTISGTITP